jgi:hypothetical protein
MEALRNRISGLESEERKRVETPEESPRIPIEAIKAESAALLARVDEPERAEKIPLPPVGLRILTFSKQRNDIVKITVSSHNSGSTDNLLTEDDNYWISKNMPNSSIQWTITGGLKTIIPFVKIMGAPSSSYGVKDFVIEGSNDSAALATIIDSKSCPKTIENCVTKAEALTQPLWPLSMIRLIQRCPRYQAGHGRTGHYLSLSYVDFGGKSVFPATAK